MRTSALICTPSVLVGELLRDAIARAFRKAEVMYVRSCRELVDAFRKRLWSVLIVDTACPREEAFDAIDRVRRRRRDLRIIFLADRVTVGWMAKAVQLRVSSFLGGCAGIEDVKRAMDAALGGQTYFTQCAVEALNRIARRDERVPSARELVVLSLVAEGHSSKEVSKMLGLSPKGVDAVRARLMRRLGARSSAELVKCAYDEKLLDVGRVSCGCGPGSGRMEGGEEG